MAGTRGARMHDWLERGCTRGFRKAFSAVNGGGLGCTSVHRVMLFRLRRASLHTLKFCFGVCRAFAGTLG